MTKKKKSQLPSSEDTLLLVKTFVSTTARLFLPTLTGTILGLVLDTMYNSKPLLTITGVICGTIVAIYLVYRQLQGVKKT